MNSDNDIMYDGVLYHLPIYQDEIVRNIIPSNKSIEYHKDVEGYIILTNYRFVFMEKIKDLEYRLSNFFYYNDINSVKTGGVVNKFIKVNGVMFHPKEISVEYIKNSLEKFKKEASKQKFSFLPFPEEEPIPEGDELGKPLYSESVNILISIYSIIIGIFLVLISAFWFYAGPHASLPFIISLLGVIFSSVTMGLVKNKNYAENYSEEQFDIIKNIFLMSIFCLILSSIGLAFGPYHSYALTINSGRNNFWEVISVVYFAVLVLIAFKIGIEFSKIPTEPEHPYNDLNIDLFDIFESEKYQELTKNSLTTITIIIMAQMAILVLYNVIAPGGIYLIFSLLFSIFPNPSDIIIFISGPNYELFAACFIGLTIASGVSILVISGIIQIKNIGNFRYFAIKIVKRIKRKIESKERYMKELRIRIKRKTDRILKMMHSIFVPTPESHISPSVNDADSHIQETIHVSNNQAVIKTSPISPEAQIKKKHIQTQATDSVSSHNNGKITEPMKETQEIPEKIIGTIDVKRGAIIKGSEYIYKIKVENLSNSVITDLKMIITSYPTDSLEIVSPEIQKRYKLGPGEMMAPTFKFRPTEDCIIGNINSIVTFLNAKGEPNQITVEPYQIKLICGLLTPHPLKAEEFNQIVKKLLNYSNAGEEIELPYNAMNIYEKAKRILPHNNFHLISAEDHLVASNFIGILKGFAAGKFSHKKVGIQITINGKKDEKFCVARLDGYTEDSSMLTPLLAEIKKEIRVWNCEQCGAQLLNSQISQIMEGKTVRCRYCDEILQL
ncbi:MAG: hypothetical protein ACTSRG_05835 [Candidatus Helarchaeota archaeon]